MEEKMEKIIKPAIRIIEDDMIFQGSGHTDIITEIFQHTGKLFKHSEIEEGYVTSLDRFISKEEAEEVRE